MLHFPYRGIHRSSDRDKTFTSYWKHDHDGVGNLIYIYKNQCLCRLSVCVCVCVCVPYRSTHRSSDCDESFTSCYKHSRGGFGNLKNLKIVLAGVPGVALSQQGHAPFIRLRLSEIVVNMLTVGLKFKEFKNCTTWSIRCCLTGAHTVHPIAT